MSAATQPEDTPDHAHHGTSDVDLKAGRRKVARSRGVLSGVLLLILGAWAALAPFIGPYFDFGFEPRSGDAWHWTSGRGLYEVLPGGVTALAGLVLLVSASRTFTVLMAWLAALSGVWLVVAPTLSAVIDVSVGSPETGASTNKVVALSLLYFFATGVAIALVAGIALGRLSVHSVRDVRAAERRAESEAAAEAQRQEAERRESERLAAQRRDADRIDHDRNDNDRSDDDRADQHDGVDDRRTAALPVTNDRDGRDDDRYAAPPAGPYEQAGNRDAAGSSGYTGHQSMGQHATGTGGAPLDDPGYRADASNPTGAHAVDPAAPADPARDPSAPPAPGGVEQYRYGTPQTPVPPEERGR